jgi:hypothetical protein
MPIRASAISPMTGKQRLRRSDVHNFLFRIPLGDPSHPVTACYMFPKDAELMTHGTHALAREGYEVRGDLNWQTEYQLARPVAIEKGTKIVSTAHFDNSPNNGYNPDPSKAIRWGEPSTEEMMDGWFEYILPPAAIQSQRQ